MLNRETVLVGLMSIAYALSLRYIGGPSNVELIAASLLLVAGCCYKFLPALTGRPIQWGLAFNLLAAYVAWLVVLVYTSTLPENSIHFAWLLASFALVTFLVADLEERSWFMALFLFALTGGVSALWGIAEFLATAHRANGPIIDPSSWCAIDNLFFFAMVYAWLCGSQRWVRYLAAAGLLVFAVAVFTAYSRVGTLVIFAGTAFIAVLGAASRRLWARLAVVVFVVAAAYGAVHMRASTVEAANAEGYTLNLHEKGWRQRIAMWHAGWEIYRDHPLVGSGLGTFKVQYPKYRTHNDMRNFGNFVHDDYLQYLLEGGPLLLAFLLGLVGTLLVRLPGAAMKAFRGDESALASATLTVAMGTLFVASLMSFPMYQLQTQMMAGLLFARYVKVNGLLSRVQISVTSPRLLQAGALLVVVVICMVPVLDAISSQLLLGGGAIPLVNGFADKSSTYVRTMQFLAVIRSQDPDNRFAMATIYRSSFDREKNIKARRALAIAAALEYQAGLERNPWHLKARLYFAEFLEQNPWLEELSEIRETPDSLYRQGIALYPVYLGPYLDYAAFLRRHHHDDKAYRLLVDGALPWADMRHDAYFFVDRHRLFVTLLREARARGDRATLRKMLNLMEPAAS